MSAPSRNATERIAALLRLEYPVLVRRGAAEVILEIESLRLIGRGPTLETAEAELERAKENLFRSYVEAGLGDEIPPPRRQGVARDVLRRSAAVVVAALVLAALLGVTGILVSGPIVTAIRSRFSPEELTVRAGSVLGEASDRLEKLSPERREQIRTDLERLVRNLQPFAQTLRPLLADPSYDPAATPRR